MHPDTHDPFIVHACHQTLFYFTVLCEYKRRKNTRQKHRVHAQFSGYLTSTLLYLLRSPATGQHCPLSAPRAQFPLVRSAS